MNVLKGLLALAVVFLFAQCTDNKGTSTEASAPAVAGTNMKIAYVEVDSLLTKYRYWNDLNELMIQKEENIRTTLNEKAKELDGEMREFQRKLENNGFASRERAEQENARLLQKQRDYGKQVLFSLVFLLHFFPSMFPCCRFLFYRWRSRKKIQICC